MSTQNTRVLPEDPRWYQIACLSSLLTFGVLRLQFDITAPRIVLILVTAQLTQWVCSRAWSLPRFDPLSAMISSLSLCLLLRTNFHAVAVFATVITIASKFMIRYDGKHIFNPTNFGLAISMLITGSAWVSPGQWGSQATLAFLFACLGSFVVFRSDRSDVTAAFAVFWSTLIIGRSWWVGEPMTIPIHRLESGAFLLFAFFMISDPKTTPNSRPGRILFAGIVAFAAWYWQFRMFHTNGLIWALFALSPVVPLIDRLLPDGKYAWPTAKSLQLSEPMPAK